MRPRWDATRLFLGGECVGGANRCLRYVRSSLNSVISRMYNAAGWHSKWKLSGKGKMWRCLCEQCVGWLQQTAAAVAEKLQTARIQAGVQTSASKCTQPHTTPTAFSYISEKKKETRNKHMLWKLAPYVKILKLNKCLLTVGWWDWCNAVDGEDIWVLWRNNSYSMCHDFSFNRTSIWIISN